MEFSTRSTFVAWNAVMFPTNRLSLHGDEGALSHHELSSFPNYSLYIHLVHGTRCRITLLTWPRL